MNETEILLTNIRLQNLVEAIYEAIKVPLVIEYINDLKVLKCSDFEKKWKAVVVPPTDILDALDELRNLT